MDTTPLVTIAIPTQNRAELLAEAIDSALAQTFDDFEVLVSDDASTDGTGELVAKYTDPRLRYVRHETKLGMAGNWNYGWKEARGRYVTILHDDDYLAPTFLERAVAAFEAAPETSLVYAKVLLVNKDGDVVGPYQPSLGSTDRLMPAAQAVERIVRNNEVAWPAILIRRDSLVEQGGFAEDFPYFKDWATWIQLASRYQLQYVAEVLGFYRLHPEQFISSYGNRVGAAAQERRAMLHAVIPELLLPAAERDRLLRIALRSLAEVQLIFAWEVARRGERRTALSEARHAFVIDRAIVLHSPQLVAAAYLGCLLPSGAVKQLDKLRGLLRPLFRRARG
jgi:glycosyl transferase family 2